MWNTLQSYNSEPRPVKAGKIISSIFLCFLFKLPLHTVQADLIICGFDYLQTRKWGKQQIKVISEKSQNKPKMWGLVFLGLNFSGT